MVEKSTESDKEYEKIMKLVQENAGIGTMMEINARYQEYLKRHNLLGTNSKRMVKTTDMDSEM